MKDKRLMINMVAQCIAFIVNVGISFLLTPFIVNNVGKEAYGFVGLANNFVNYAQIVTIALNSMAGRFITISLYKNDQKSVNKYFTSVIVANIIITSIMTVPSVIIVLFINKIVHISSNILFDVRLLWAFIFLNFLISIIGSAFGIATFARNRLDLQSIRAIESNIIKVIVLFIAFCFFKPSVWYIGLASFLCTIYVTIANVYYTKKLLPKVQIKKKYFDINAVKILISSGMWSSITKISSIFSSGLDLFMANIFINASSMGILSISKTVPAIILSVFAMLSSIFSPQLTISYAKNDFKEIKKQLLESMKILGMLSCIPMAILFAYGDAFYGLWVPHENHRLLQILSIIACLELIFALPQESLWNVFTATNKVKQSSIALFCEGTLSIITTIIALLFVKNHLTRLYIIAGVSTVFAIIRACTFLPIYGAVCLKLKLTTFYPLIIRNTVSVAVLTVISLLIRKTIIINSWMKLILVCIITGVIGILLNYSLILKRQGIKIIRSKF